MRAALQLRKLFEYIGDRMGIHLEVVITDGAQPVGRGIGPVLEARDVMQVLRNDPEAPSDLRQKSLRLAGRLLEFDPDVRGGYGYAIARDILDSGRALARMEGIMAAQGVQTQTFAPGALQFEVCAAQDGVVTAIDNFHIARTARLAGAPMDKGAGVDLLKKLGDHVATGEPLYRVYAEYRSDYHFAKAYAEQQSGYTIGTPEQVTRTYLEF
jgi:thymidine phosphorylase